MTMKRILIVEDDSAFATWLLGHLRQDGWKTTHAETVEAALEHIDKAPPDLGIIDIGLPDGEGLEVIARLGALTPAVPSLVMTLFDDDDVFLRALERGAVGYVLKEDSAIDVRLAVEASLRGHCALSPRMARFLVNPLRQRARDAQEALSCLTPRERQVATMLGKGSSYAEVASMLGVTLGTVQTYVKQLYRKLGVTSKTDLTYLIVSDWHA